MIISKKTPVDIILTPLVTIVAGGLIAKYCCSPINDFMLYLGSLINNATKLNPFLMGITISVLVGCALTLPISSVAICVMLGIDGLAAGAATFVYAPKLNGEGGVIVDYKVEISNDGITWTPISPVVTFNNIVNNPISQEIIFSRYIDTRYLKLIPVRAMEAAGNSSSESLTYGVSAFGCIE